MTINRRKALTLLGLGAASPVLSAGTASAHEAKAVFAHGVASGDPLADRLIIWTRVSTAAEAKPMVRWELAIDAGFKSIVAKGQAVADPARDHTVKIDVGGLKPGADYHYRFICQGVTSPVGRGRTLPVGAVKDVVLAVASCSLYPAGYFNAYQAIAKLERVDAVLHLGDYIYEYGAAPDDYGMSIGAKIGRITEPAHEIVSLSDYRARHALYKSDPDLQAAHARAPWIVVWDDHETANDSWTDGAENHQQETEGDWATRKAAALRAYHEWMPIRDPAPGQSLSAINRSFSFGDVATLIMTETRLTARDKQLTFAADLMIKGPDGQLEFDEATFNAKLNHPSRQLMGPGQEAWLGQELDRSVKAGQTWQVLGNQVVMARVKGPQLAKAMGAEAWAALLAKAPAYYREQMIKSASRNALEVPYNLDSWDGYPAARERVYDLFKAAKAHPIVLSGDSHAFWVNALFDASGKARVAAEFGATGITSPGLGDALPDAPVNEAYVSRNPEVLFTDQSAKGYVLLTLTKDGARGDLMAVSTVVRKAFETKTLASWVVTPEQGGGVGPLKRV
jgi:alkaline phosphatase D